MEFIRHDTNIGFIPNAPKFLLGSGILVLLSWIVTLIMGLNYGIDFAGGTEIQVKFKNTVGISDIRAALDSMPGIKSEVQSFGAASKNEFLLKLARISYVTPERKTALETGLKNEFEDKGFRRFFHSESGGDKVEFTVNEKVDEAKIKDIFKAADLEVNEVTVTGSEGRFVYRSVLAGLGPHVSAALETKFGKDTFEILRLDSVGPKVGAELKQKGFLALLYAIIGILIYIAFRFDFRFAPGAIVALVHDVSITVGIFAFLGIEFTIPTIAAILTIVGYSINDTIVVYDRIRENLSKAKVKPLEVVVNESINQTLSRTILTSFTTLLVVVSLLIFGGSIIFDFALALFIGISVGTYSSIFIASPIMIYLYRFIEKRSVAAAQAK